VNTYNFQRNPEYTTCIFSITYQILINNPEHPTCIFSITYQILINKYVIRKLIQ